MFLKAFEKLFVDWKPLDDTALQSVSPESGSAQGSEAVSQAVAEEGWESVVRK